MIYALEGLRGIAALAVALFHGWESIVSAPFSQGWLCVDLFFVISGFVMSHVYADSLSAGHQVVAFGLKRFGRLYPLHIFTLFAFILSELLLQAAKPLASLLTGHSTNPPTFDLVEGWSLLSNVFLLHGIGLEGARSYNGPSWSISVEMWTYVIFAASAFLLRGKARAAVWACLSLAGLALWASASSASAHDGSYFFRCLYGFFLGALLPSLRVQRSDAVQVLAVTVALGIFALLDWLPVLRFAGACAFALLVLSVSMDDGPVARVLRLPVFQTLGRLSYSVYMTHWVLLVFFNPLGQALPEPYRSLLKVVYVGAVLGVSALTYRRIEAPWRKQFREISAASSPEAQSTASVHTQHT